MAPEFFPIFACAGLALLSLMLVAGALVPAVPRRLLEFAFPLVLRHLRLLFLLALVPCLALTLLLSYYTVRQLTLNEPMAIAASEGNLAKVRALLDRGASPDSWGIDAVSPALVYAVRGSRADIVQLLLERGADPTIRDSDGVSALSYARKAGNGQIVDLLVKAGARE